MIPVKSDTRNSEVPACADTELNCPRGAQETVGYGGSERWIGPQGPAACLGAFQIATVFCASTIALAQVRRAWPWPQVLSRLVRDPALGG
jgi:hypothetical protein